jgi:choline dehydrogenase-like flavoprotein
MEGCTLAGHCINGCPHGPSVEKIAKRSTNVSYVPLALKTGNVTIRPNTFTSKILTENDPQEGLRVKGIQFRDTWTGETGELYADVVVMAAGCIETPRLWLSSGLPHNPWVGRGLTNHFFDRVEGIFDEKDLISILGTPDANPFVGQTSGARLDYPGLGHLQVVGLSPGLMALLNFSSSQSGFSSLHKPEPEAPWKIVGSVFGSELKELMADYRRTMGMLIITDDEVDWQNGVTLDPFIQDEHGPVPVVRYFPTKRTTERRNQLAKIAADILLKAGAKKVIRSNVSPGIFIHLESTMRMGFVTDMTCEAFQVKRLYIADNSVHYNSIGGPNPTLTTQALATRTAEKLVQKYFS